MPNKKPLKNNIDYDALNDCALAFHGASGIGCTVTDTDGNLLNEYGYGIQSCEMCAVIGRRKNDCTGAHIYGMAEAERFGGRYIYYCPSGLLFFVTPVADELHSRAKLTAGPFLMVSAEDYIACELEHAPKKVAEQAFTILKRLPLVPAPRVEHLSKLLFMSGGFMHNLAALERLKDSSRSQKIQGEIGGYIQQLKVKEQERYPLETEKELLRCIERGDIVQSQNILNKLFGHIMFESGYNTEQLLARSYSLMVLVGRACMAAGVDEQHAMSITDEGVRMLSGTKSAEQICLWLSKTTTALMDSVFDYRDMRHASAIRTCLNYIDEHYSQKISLSMLAKKVYLSVPYLSRIFHKETGHNFNDYLNLVRVDKSKMLLKTQSLRIADIASAVGFEDQSYFTKVFKRYCGVTPNMYRESTN